MWKAADGTRVACDFALQMFTHFGHVRETFPDITNTSYMGTQAYGFINPLDPDELPFDWPAERLCVLGGKVDPPLFSPPSLHV